MRFLLTLLLLCPRWRRCKAWKSTGKGYKHGVRDFRAGREKWGTSTRSKTLEAHTNALTEREEERWAHDDVADFSQLDQDGETRKRGMGALYAIRLARLRETQERKERREAIRRKRERDFPAPLLHTLAQIGVRCTPRLSLAMPVETQGVGPGTGRPKSPDSYVMEPEDDTPSPIAPVSSPSPPSTSGRNCYTARPPSVSETICTSLPTAGQQISPRERSTTTSPTLPATLQDCERVTPAPGSKPKTSISSFEVISFILARGL